MSSALVLAPVSSTNAAAEWIRGRWEAWLQLNDAFPALMQRAARVATRTSADASTRQAAKDSIRRTKELWDLYALTTERARAIAGLIPGLGNLRGFLWPAAVIAIALSIAWVTTRYNAEREVVQMLEQGELTPEQARQLLAELEGGPLISGGTGAGLAVSAVGLVGVAALLWFGTQRPPRG